MFFADNAGSSDRFNAPRKKNRLGVPVAKRSQHFVPAEKIDILLLDGQARGHFVSAVLVDLVRASSQCLDQIKAFNATATSFTDASFVKTDDNCRPLMFVRDA